MDESGRLTYEFVTPYYDDHGIVRTRHETKPFTEAELNALNDCGDVKWYRGDVTRDNEALQRWYRRGGGR